MGNLLHSYPGDGVTICTDVTALTLPPPSFGLVDGVWNIDFGTIPEFDLEIWADGARALTVATLYGASTHEYAFADITVTANAGTDAFAAVAHGLLTGDGPVVVTGADVPLGIDPFVAATLDFAAAGCANLNTVVRAREPSAGVAGDAITVQLVGDAGAGAGSLTESGTAVVIHFKIGVSTVTNVETLIGSSTLIEVATAGTGASVLTAGDVLAATHLRDGADGTFYWVTEGADADHFLLALSRTAALEGDNVDLTDAGSGTIKVADVPAEPTERVHWHSHGLLGLNADGIVDLDAQKGYTVKCRHRPRAIAYALTATFGAGSGTVSASIYPSQEI